MADSSEKKPKIIEIKNPVIIPEATVEEPVEESVKVIAAILGALVILTIMVSVYYWMSKNLAFFSPCRNDLYSDICTPPKFEQYCKGDGDKQRSRRDDSGNNCYEYCEYQAKNRNCSYNRFCVNEVDRESYLDRELSLKYLFNVNKC